MTTSKLRTRGDADAKLTVLIVHSNNVTVFQQMEMLGDAQHIVIVCMKGKGYVIVCSPDNRGVFVPNKRWQIEHPGALSFSVPGSANLYIEHIPSEKLLSRYPAGRSGWEDVSRARRWDGVLPVSRGPTAG